MILITVIHIAETYLVYEVVVGLQVVRNALTKVGKKHAYIPPTLFHVKGREDYLNWKEWKGDRF